MVLVAGRPAIVCSPRGGTIELPRLGFELGGDVLERSSADLPAPFTNARGPLPPLGGLLGGVTVIDERLVTAAVLCFDAFSPFDWVEMLYDDFSRIERRRIASFVIGCELSEHEPRATVA